MLRSHQAQTKEIWPQRSCSAFWTEICYQIFPEWIVSMYKSPIAFFEGVIGHFFFKFGVTRCSLSSSPKRKYGDSAAARPFEQKSAHMEVWSQSHIVNDGLNIAQQSHIVNDGQSIEPSPKKGMNLIWRKRGCSAFVWIIELWLCPR